MSSFAQSAPGTPKAELEAGLGVPKPKLTHSASTSSSLLAPPPDKKLNKAASSSSLRRTSSKQSLKGASPALDAAAAITKTWAPLPGHIGNLTPIQEKALDELRDRLDQAGLLGDDSQAASSAQRRRFATRGESTTDEREKKKKEEEEDDFPYQDLMLLRFLRARQFNVETAYQMYAKAAAWRREVDIDRCLEQFHFTEQEAVASHGWRMYWHKTDKLGRPIFVQNLNNIDPAAVFGQCTTPDRIIKRFACTLELACRERYQTCTKAAGHIVEDNFMILDIGGLGFNTFWSMKSQLQKLLGILDANYPELSGRVQIINAPWAFTTIWSWVKGWLPIGTRDKVDIQGADYLPTLLEWIEPESLPQSLGGSCTDCGEWSDGGREFEAMFAQLSLVGGATLGEAEREEELEKQSLGAGRAWGADRDADARWKTLGAEIRERRGPCKAGCDRSDLGPWDRTLLRGR